MATEARTVADDQIARGNKYEDDGALDEALSCYLDAVTTAPDYPRAQLNLASVLELLGRTDDALLALQTALTLDPKYAPGYFNLGKLHASHGQHEAAERELRSAFSLDPLLVDAMVVLASVYEAHGKADQAEAALRCAADSGSAGAAHNLGVLLKSQSRLDEAEESFGRALALDPNFADAYVGLGNLWLQTRRAREAYPLFRKALSISPAHWEAASNLLFSMSFRDDLPAAAIYDEHVSVARTLERGKSQARAPRRGDDGTRRLKIGFVSGDFGHHPVGLFMRPVLANRDRDHFEVYCYCNREPDLDLTRELKASSDHWRDISLLKDDQAESLVRSDAIDILVDLSGYTAGSRLPVFMRRPAAVQVSWLGYLNTTGLQSIDYRVTDRYADPPGSEHLYSEQLVRLPDSQWCYQPYYQVTLPPPRDNDAAVITFGCFNQFAKLSDGCLGLWCEILKQVPDSVLRIVGVPGGSAENALRSRVESHGVDPRRIDTIGRLGIHEYFAAFSNVDIALDTFPYNGATTTLDTLWMGVPLVAVAGNTAVARSSFSILSSLQAQELLANSPADLVARNVALARDATRRHTLRRSLRSRLEISPLMNAHAFTRGLEEAFRTMWRDDSRLARAGT